METRVKLPGDFPARLTKWKVKVGSRINQLSVLCLYKNLNNDKVERLKWNNVGTVKQLLFQEGEEISPGADMLEIAGCTHPTVMKDMCAECGADLRGEIGRPGTRKDKASASVAMVHSVPELIVSQQEAMRIGKEDESRLHRHRKLVLLVDLDQTLIHTTNDNVPANLRDVVHFQLWHGQNLLWYHTKFRPRTEQFMEKISQLYEMHICTFGVRMYAHTIAKFLDPEGKFFSHRILSRNECFNPNSKTANLKALFPCGDTMVAIIDDREDVWNYAVNLIPVKPYSFFDGTADINAPPGSAEEGKEDKEGDSNKGSSKKPKRTSRAVRVRKKKRDKFDNADAPELSNTENIQDGSSDQKKEGDSKKSDSMDAESKEKTNEDSKKSDSTGNESSDTKMEEDPKENDNNQDESSGKKNEEASRESESKENKPDGSAEVESSSEAPTTNDKPKDDDKPDNQDTKSDDKKAADEVDDQNEANVDNEKHDDKEDQHTDTKETDKNGTENTTETKEDKSEGESEGEYEDLVEWDDNDDYLLYLEDILKRIHTAYYELYDQMCAKGEKNEVPDMKSIIPYVKKKVLKGTNLLFSGVIPVSQPIEKSRVYHVAKSLGANVHTDLALSAGEGKEMTTHLIAARLGTAKVNAAVKHKTIAIVNPEWLWACAERWERVDEKLFTLTEGMNMTGWDSPGRSITPEGGAKFKGGKLRKRGSTGSFKGKKMDYKDRDDAGGEKKYANKAATEGGQNQPDDQQPGTSQGSSHSRRFSETYNPLYAFSDVDIATMDKEVEDLLESGSDSDDDDSSGDDEELRRIVLGQKRRRSTSSEESLGGGEFPRGWKPARKRGNHSGNDDNEGEAAENSDDGAEGVEDKPVTPDNVHKLFKFDGQSSSSDNSDCESIGSVDEEMAAAVEKEFLSF